MRVLLPKTGFPAPCPVLDVFGSGNEEVYRLEEGLNWMRKEPHLAWKKRNLCPSGGYREQWMWR